MFSSVTGVLPLSDKFSDSGRVDLFMKWIYFTVYSQVMPKLCAVPLCEYFI